MRAASVSTEESQHMQPSQGRRRMRSRKLVAAQEANQQVSLFHHGFARVVQLDTNAAGEYSFPPQSPVSSTFYRVETSDPACKTAPPPVRGCRARRLSSAVLYEGVRDVLTAQLSATTVQAGASITVSGTVAPDHTGHVIYLERQNAKGSGFHVIEVAFVGGGSSFSIAHRLYDPGTKVLRVYIPGGPENLGVASQPLTVQVTPAIVSTLTPESSENSSLPSEGQS
jgi:hypothetical protein